MNRQELEQFIAAEYAVASDFSGVPYEQKALGHDFT
jgi:hypothetical protein